MQSTKENSMRITNWLAAFAVCLMLSGCISLHVF